MVGQERVCQKSGRVQLDVTCIKKRDTVFRSQKRVVMRRKRKRSTTRRRRVSQVGGFGPAVPISIMKAGYGITKAIGDHQTKRAIAIGEKRRREVASGKRKKYAGESFNCSIM